MIAGCRSDVRGRTPRASESGCAATGLNQPRTRFTLGFGDFPCGHLFSDFGAARLPFFAPGQGGKIKPFMRFHEVDIHAHGAAAIGDAEIVARLGVAHHRIAHSAFDQE